MDEHTKNFSSSSLASVLGSRSDFADAKRMSCCVPRGNLLNLFFFSSLELFLSSLSFSRWFVRLETAPARAVNVAAEGAVVPAALGGITPLGSTWSSWTVLWWSKMKEEEGVTVTTGSMAFVAMHHRKNRTLLQESVAFGVVAAGSRPASNALMVARQATNKCSALGERHSMKGF